MIVRAKHIRRVAKWITDLRHAEHPENYRRNYIDYYYFGRLLQYRDLVGDRILKRPHKTIDYDGEFGTELKFVIPFAYWHHCNGTLLRTASARDTRAFYFFSKVHEEKYPDRRWKPYFNGLPNSEDHNLKYNLRQWRRVPYKEVFTNDLFVFEKPILLVANKYNVEWGGPPINFMSLDLIRAIFTECSSQFQIIYNRPKANHIANDDSEILRFGDHEMIRSEFPHVIDMGTLYKETKLETGKTFNEFQLMVYSNCSHFVSIHGGASVLASYFGGVNIIYSICGFEHYFREFETFYPKMSGARIFHACSDEEVMSFVRDEIML